MTQRTSTTTSGLAVIASNAGEIAALVRDGQSDLVCPPGDAAALCRALLRLAHDAGLRARLGAAARREAERHTWSENARIVAHLAAAVSLDRRAPAMIALAAGGER